MKSRRRSEFVDILVVTATALGMTMAELNKNAGVGRDLMYRAQRGATPQKRCACALTNLVINRVNAQIRTRAEEIAKLQHYGEALKAAYVKSYGPIEEVAR